MANEWNLEIHFNFKFLNEYMNEKSLKLILVK